MYCCSMKLPIYKAFTYLMILALGFLLGLLTHSIVARVITVSKPEEGSPYARRVEEWHRLYEAAGMTGDPVFRQQVWERLMCTNNEGEVAGLYVQNNLQSGCQVRHDAPLEVNFGPGHEFGNFSTVITKSHLSWSVKNLRFLKSIDSAQKAKLYFLEHRWPG